ncbi:hypothetical protein R1flu_001838 [Riccia fluitans]|uniref:Uncharacterized protein n=1 Tax=Riccia fluitans TaxID=41844 RepID=A0ABD1Y4N2_9MARC
MKGMVSLQRGRTCAGNRNLTLRRASPPQSMDCGGRSDHIEDTVNPVLSCRPISTVSLRLNRGGVEDGTAEASPFSTPMNPGGNAYGFTGRPHGLLSTHVQGPRPGGPPRMGAAWQRETAGRFNLAAEYGVPMQ